MSTQINNIINANIYLAGSNLLGCADEVKLPVLKSVMKDHKALGMFGRAKLPNGFEAMEGEIKWNSFYTDVFLVAANPLKSVQLMCRSNVETWNSQGLAEEKELVTIMTVTFTEYALGSFKQGEAAEFPGKFSANYVKQTCGGKEIIEYDVFANIFKIGGVDQLTNFRNNIGG